MSSTPQKIALVTGASSGMGKVIAQQLIKDGLKVIVAARGVDKMADLEQLGAHAIGMDISKEADVIAAAEQILSTYGGVDVLINNAGFGLYGAVEDITIDEARYQFEVNVFGLARLTQLLLPAMRAKKAGTIVNITSMGGKMYTPLGAWYHATKHALEGWSDCLRLELADKGIHVVIVEPGVIQTGFGGLTEPLLKRSGGGAYAALARTVATATDRSYQRGQASPAQVIADVVSKAVHATRPKTRYVAGKYARPLMFLRKWLSDRLFDRVIMSTVK